MFLLSATCLFTGLALAAPPTEESVMSLYKLMKADALVDSIYENMKARIVQTRSQLDPGNRISAEQRRAFDNAVEKSMALVRQEFTTQKMQQQFTAIYSDSFTQEEIDGLTTFYASPVGQSFISKMPVVTQKYLASAQAQIQILMPRMVKIIEESVKEGR